MVKIFKTPTEIENETGEKFVDICNKLMSEGLSTTEIAIRLKLKHAGIVSSTLARKKFENLELNDEYTRDIKDYLKSPLRFYGNMRERFEDAFTTVHSFTYKYYLHKKYIDDKLSQAEIGALLGVDTKTVGNHLKFYNIKKTLAEARMDAISKGVVDYENIIVQARKTRAKSISQSNIQEWVRQLFKVILFKSIKENPNTKDIEFVIGLDEWGILKDKEVDIPIIVICNNFGVYLKYSIELNHENWHKQITEKDQRKLFRLTQNGWRHFIIELKSNSTYAPLEEQVKEISTKIIDDIKQEVEKKV